MPLLFAYGSLRAGEVDHPTLSEATPLGDAELRGVRLVDLGPYPALIEVGAATASDSGAVVGELYEVDIALLRKLDVLKQHPALFQRQVVTLGDGRQVHTFMMRDEQVRGRKRLKSGDWKKRFELPPSAAFSVPRRWTRRF